MKRSGYTPFRKLLPAAFLLLTMLWACTGHEEDIIRSSDGDALVTFSLRVPGESVPDTRALSEDSENAVTEIDVLVFKANGGEYVYSAGCSGSQITGTGSTKTFTVTLRRGEYDLVVLANARTAVSAADLTGKTKATALDALTAAVPSGGKWPADGTKPFPMWGDIGTKTINETAEIKNISLLRMVARVDVVIPDAVTNFKLASIHVYNYNTHGTLVPNAAAALSGGKVTYPTVPAASTLTEGPILYDGTAINTTSNQSVREIYIMESENHTDNHTKPKDLLQRTCLVIGGTYGTDGKPSYYRVDFSTGTGTSQAFLDVLRNHKYTVNITGVSGSGYEDAETAFKSGPVNIEAGITVWDAGNMGTTKFDGQNILSVSQDAFSFSRDAKTGEESDNVLYVKTDYETDEAATTGWRIKSIVDAADGTTPVTWLTPSVRQGEANDKTKVVLTFPANDAAQPRTAIITIAAGRLRIPVTVTQSLTAALGITITNGSSTPITELVFSSAAGIMPVSQELNVSWMPKEADLSITCTPVGSNGFPTGVGEPQNGTESALGNSYAGKKSYTITPGAMSAAELESNPFLEKVSKVDFMVSNGVSNATSSVFLRQLNYGILAEEIGVPLDGGTYSFRVKSNTSWRIKSITERPSGHSTQMLALKGTDNLKVGTTGQYDITQGKAVTFTVITDDTKLMGTIDVVFESIDGRFADYTHTIHIIADDWARSNIVWDGTKLTFAVSPADNARIPANAQGVFFQWGSLVAISPVGSNYSSSQVLFSPTGATYSSWTSIPYINETTAPFNDSDANADDFASYNGNTGYNAATGKGDICRYISKEKKWVSGSWRLPTQKEYDNLMAEKTHGATYGSYANTGVTPSGTSAKGDNANGFYPIPSGRILGKDATTSDDITNPATGVFFPAAGNRISNGAADNAGFYGFFWSGSSNSASDGFLMTVYSSGARQANSSRQYGFSVRCVRE